MLKASKNDYKNFIDSAVWHDICGVLKARLEIVRNDLERADNDNIDILRGEAKEIRFLLNLPQYIVDNYEKIMLVEKEE